MATPGTPVPVPPPAPNKPALGDWVQLFRELVTSVISITILCVSVWMMVSTYNSGKQKIVSANPDKDQNAVEVKAVLDAFGREKDLLLYALALLGTVTGYYLGRVPAELRAQQAQQNANTSQNQLAATQGQLGTATVAATQAATNLTHATATLGNVRAKLATAAGPVRKTLTAEATAAPEQQAILDAQREIDEYFAKN
jgi:hypothetical protein